MEGLVYYLMFADAAQDGQNLIVQNVSYILHL